MPSFMLLMSFLAWKKCALLRSKESGLQQTELGPRPAATPGCALPDESCTDAREKPLSWPGLSSESQLLLSPDFADGDIKASLGPILCSRRAKWASVLLQLLATRGKTTCSPPVECLENRQANQSSQTENLTTNVLRLRIVTDHHLPTFVTS